MLNDEKFPLFLLFSFRKMSNPSCPAQKSLSEEDSSGSEAGSEVSVEPAPTETDRFGFILTNGSTAGSVGPPPEVVRQREAKWINIISQWDRVLLKKTNKVKGQCQKGIPASLRAKCWPLLCGATDRMKHNEDLYRSLDSQPALQSWVDVIERDLDRQFPFHEMFLSRDGHGQRGLFRVLKAYTQYQPEEGYCQAQGPVAAVLLMNMPAEEAFWCLVQISEQYLPGYYSPLLEGVLFDAAMLTWVLKRTCPAAHRHLQRHGVEPLMFATDWLMCLFTRHLPFNTLLRVWDLFFCYGVRVLFQVAVVLVRRVLGRSEQRHECQGQMETLERLRSVREQVQQEDDTFITEVCSVQLSGKDLQKQTEKELQKWRKDRPSSTFDPRGRCYGYRMAWARARKEEEERDRTEREKGNLSVPLVRSASTLSLSPSLLSKRWRKGGKGNAGEWEGGGRVVRHLSMGARERGWESWADLNLKKVQCVEEEEDKASEEHRKQSEPKLAGQLEQKELADEPEELAEEHSVPTQHLEEGEKQVQQQIEQAEPSKDEKEESEPRGTEESQRPAEVPDVGQTENSAEEDRTEETEPTQDPVNAQFAGNVSQHTEHTAHHKQGEELDCNSQSQGPEQQSHNTQDTEDEMVQQVAETEHMVAMEEKQTEIKTDVDIDTNTDVEMQAIVDISEELMTQADMKPEEETEIENVQQIKMDTVTEIRMENELQTKTETSLGSQIDTDVEALTVKTPDPAIQTKMQQEPDEITQTDRGSQADASEVRNQDTEQLAEMEMKAESHTQTETETDVPAETQEKVELNTGTQEEPETEAQAEAEQDVESLIDGLSPEETKAEAETASLTECILQKEETDLVVLAVMESMTTLVCAETDSEISVAESTMESDKALAECSEEECEIVAVEPTETKEEIVLAAHTQAEADKDTSICDQTQEEETPTETQTHPETTEAVTPPEKTETSTQLDSTAEPDGKTSSLQTVTPGQPAPEPPKSQIAIGPVEEEERKESVKEKVEGAEDVCMSSPSQSVLPSIPQPVHEDECCTTDTPHTASSPQLHNKDDSHLPAVQVELTQAAGHRISISSGDFRLRKSSSSHGSRLARRLSEDLFTAPQLPAQLSSIPAHPDQTEHTVSPSNPGATNSTQTGLDTTQSGASNQEETVSLSKEVTGGTEGTAALQSAAKQEQRPPPDTSKRFGLFRRLRGEQPKKGTPKMQVPKILIQDFSDGVGMASPIEEEGEEKLSSRERRRRRRERERREKEEEKQRRKREKELEKERERERRKPQTKGKRDKGSADGVPPGNSDGSQTLRYSAPYAESYF
ncbi:uncharacterized protein tbc1d10c isoform X1 [Centroberyx gerrardi]